MRAVHFYSKICYDFTSIQCIFITNLPIKMVCAQSQTNSKLRR
nr:MAG TPA: hypothetical protein [Caudoviricetes sp.]